MCSGWLKPAKLLELTIVAAWVCKIKGSNCALDLDNAQLPYLEAYNALFVL